MRRFMSHDLAPSRGAPTYGEQPTASLSRRELKSDSGCFWEMGTRCSGSKSIVMTRELGFWSRFDP